MSYLEFGKLSRIHFLTKYSGRRILAVITIIASIFMTKSVISRINGSGKTFAGESNYSMYVKKVLDIPKTNPIFKALDNKNHIFLTSVYLEPDYKTIRIFILKHIKVKATFECHLRDELYGKYVMKSTELKQNCIYGGIYRGYITFCKMPSPIPPGLLLTVKRRDGSDRDPTVSTSIAPGLPPLDETRPKMSHMFGLCLTAVFNSRSYSADFLIEYLELHRKLGLSFIAIYTAEELAPTMRRVLQSYITQPSMNGNRSLVIQVVNWILPIANASHNTWYHEQTLSQNDCLHRFGREVEYLFNTDLDEILIPTLQHLTYTTDLPTWHDLLPGLRKAFKKSETLCFPGKFFPPVKSMMNSKVSIFDRQISTVENYPERAKCMIYSGFVSEAYVHRPIIPQKYRLAPELAVIYHYRSCLRKSYNKCPPGTKYATNDGLQAYRTAISQNVFDRKLLI